MPSAVLALSFRPAGLTVGYAYCYQSNAEEARLMTAKAAEKNLVLMEAAHWYYHPFR